jgi:hypothetical protein
MGWPGMSHVLGALGAGKEGTGEQRVAWVDTSSLYSTNMLRFSHILDFLNPPFHTLEKRSSRNIPRMNSSKSWVCTLEHWMYGKYKIRLFLVP